jgi:hypothetical protein
MKTSVNLYDFRDAFKAAQPSNRHYHPNSFSYDGLGVLFEYLESYEEDCGDEFELDVISIRCEYTEWENYDEFKKSHPSIPRDEISDHTILIDVDGVRFITEQF